MGAKLSHQLAYPGYTGMSEFLPHKVSYSWHYFKVYNIKGLHLDFKALESRIYSEDHVECTYEEDVDSL